MRLPPVSLKLVGVIIGSVSYRGALAGGVRALISLRQLHRWGIYQNWGFLIASFYISFMKTFLQSW